MHLVIPSSNTKTFNNILESFDYLQHVNFPTHIHSHWLDLFISRCNQSSDIIDRIFSSDGLSDHFMVIAELSFQIIQHPTKETISFRKTKNIDIETFSDDILNSQLLTKPKQDLSGLCEQFFSVLREILDRHAPLLTKHVPNKTHCPWYTEEIEIAKQRRRALEKLWRKPATRTPLNRSRYRAQVNLCNRLLSKARSEYYAKTIEQSSGNSKQMWNSVNKILHRVPKHYLPDHTSLKLLANSFVQYFGKKNEIIRSNFPLVPLKVPDIKPKDVNCPLYCFRPATQDENKNIIMSSSNGTSNLDPIPTTLLKSCIDSLIVPITDIVNKSLKEGVFPSAFKTAHVIPLLKKPSLDKNDLKNYRPFSNLSFISKVVEKVVASRLLTHVELNDLSNPNQSAYKKNHSTETTLHKITNDITTNMEKKRVTVLTLSDLSAAFDTIDHAALIKLLSSCFGISGIALDWIQSYLYGQYMVKIGGNLSDSYTIKFGVPQGSVLGPILFTLYTTSLSSMIKKHSLVNHQLYADDTQVYLGISLQDATASMEKLKLCLNDIKAWMTNAKLKLNPSKTKLLLIGTKQQRKQFLSLFSYLYFRS